MSGTGGLAPERAGSGVRRDVVARVRVVFDLDGTLIDSAPGIARALEQTGLAREPVSVERVRRLVSFGADRLIQDALGLPPEATADGLARFRALYAVDPCSPDDLYPGAQALLSRLAREGIAVAICTNKPQHLADLAVARAGLADLVAAIVGAAPGRPAKPDPASLREAILALPGDEPVRFVGDSTVDALTAQAAAVPFVFAVYGYGPLDRGLPCAGTIRALHELPGVLDALERNNG